MRTVFRFLTCFLFCGALLVLAALCGLSLYYRGIFPVNTWINGIYCTGKTVEQVNEELAAGASAVFVTVTGAGGVSESIAMSAADIRPDYKRALREYLERCDSEKWLNGMRDDAGFWLDAERYEWNEEKLWSSFASLSFVTEERAKEDGVRICYESGAGYRLEDGNVGRLDTEKAYAYLKSCLYRGKTEVDLEAGGCYLDREDEPEDREQRALWQKISAFTHRGLVYDMGTESIPLTAGILCGFLKRQEDGSVVLDEKGSLSVDEAAVRDWVEQLAAAYDTCGTEREFVTTDGGSVTVKYGTYGTRLNVEDEIRYLLKAVGTERGGDLQPAETEVHVPSYRQQGYVRGLDDIGSTYIEVDMTKQHMYFYREGELVLDTPVVTGDVAKRRETPEGIYYVYGKQRDCILTGGDYATPVKYWMPVVRGVGIHDAGWRKAFGDEIYKTNGSHGCINAPPDIASQLYDAIEVGVPVIMFYETVQTGH